MPSRKRKKRKGLNLQPAPLLWLLFAINCLVGVYFSPLTSLRKVRVVNAPLEDQSRIVKIMQRAKNVPLNKLDFNGLASSIMNNTEIKDANINCNIFGRAIVRVYQRVPIARLKSSNQFFDTTGTLFVSSNEYGDLPEITVPKESRYPSVTLLSGWFSGRMAQLCKLLAAQVPNNQWNIEVNDRGVISLKASSGANVVMGSSDSLPQKIEKLGNLLAERPQLLKELRQLNLTDPESPMVIR